MMTRESYRLVPIANPCHPLVFERGLARVRVAMSKEDRYLKIKNGSLARYRVNSAIIGENDHHISQDAWFASEEEAEEKFRQEVIFFARIGVIFEDFFIEKWLGICSR